MWETGDNSWLGTQSGCLTASEATSSGLIFSFFFLISRGGWRTGWVLLAVDQGVKEPYVRRSLLSDIFSQSLCVLFC